MTLAHPAWLVLLVLIPLLAVGAILTSRLRKNQWRAFVAPRLRAALLKAGSPIPRWLSLGFLLLALALLIGSLSRPQGDAGTRTEVTKGRNILFALDLSRSMLVSDVKPDRLSQAKAMIYEMLDATPNDRVGLIGFAGTAYLFSPLTIDHAAVRETVEQLDNKWIPTGGSDIAVAVKLAVETLKKTGQKNNALVLISDGEEHEGDLSATLAEAERAGLYIFTIGVGTENGDFVLDQNFADGHFRDRQGNTVISRLHPDILRKIASETKGRFALAGSGTDIPELVRSGMAGLDEFEMKGRDRKLVVEYYQWLVAPAILALMAAILAGTRWRGFAGRAAVASTLVLAAGMPSSDAATDSTAGQALASGKWEQAKNEFGELARSAKRPETAARYHLGEASAAYRSSDFRNARTAYSQALLSDDTEVDANAHFGLGNTLFQLGWQSLSDDEPYGVDPEHPPDLDVFEGLVIKQLDKWIRSEAPESGESEGYTRFQSLIEGWTDAIRHYESALRIHPKDATLIQNRDLVTRYLERLKDLLKELESQQGQSMQGEGQGQGQQPEGQEGEGGEEEQDGNGRGKNRGKQNGEQGEEEQGSGGDQEQDKNGKNGKEKDKDDDGKDGKGPKPGETPEERARRILGENADMQKGPLAPGRTDFRRPEKDW